MKASQRLLGSLSNAAHRVLEPSLGTISPNPWIPDESIELGLRMIPGPVSPDSEVIFVVVPAHAGLADVSILDVREDASLPISDVAHDSAELASAVREYSGLSSSALSKIFPVSRETYQRWVSGNARPTAHNLRRLHQLADYVSAVSSVTNPRNFLLRPMSASPEGETAYDLLCQGRLAEAWTLLSASRPSQPYVPFKDAEGNRGLRVRGVPRVGLDETPEDEYDDFS